MRKDGQVWLPFLKRKGTTPLFQAFINTGQTTPYIKKSLGFKKGIDNYKYLDGFVTHEMKTFSQYKTQVEQRIKQKGYFNSAIRSCYRQSRRLLNLSQKISKIKNFKSKTNKQLAELFKSYSDEILKLTPWLMLIIPIEMILEEQLTNKLKGKLGKQKPKLLSFYLKILIFPKKRSLPVKAAIELTELAAFVQRNKVLNILFRERPVIEIKRKIKNKAVLVKINDYIKKFGFMKMEYYAGEPTKVAEVILNIKDLLKGNPKQRLEEIKEEIQLKKKQYSLATKELKLSKETAALVRYMQEFHYLRQYRFDALCLAGFYVLDFLKEIAIRMGIKYDDLVYLTYEEIIAFLDQGRLTDKKIIRARQKGNGIVTLNSKTEVVVGEELGRELSLIKSKKKEAKEIKGVVACVGRHRGKVKIIEMERDIVKIKRGDVLVTPMTNPYYVPAMVKAGAIVTDEGGILSHAAIVSRELGIPCVIATKIATEVLKDGDLIEVDAEKGIVKRLKK